MRSREAGDAATARAAAMDFSPPSNAGSLHVHPMSGAHTGRREAGVSVAWTCRRWSRGLRTGPVSVWTRTPSSGSGMTSQRGVPTSDPTPAWIAGRFPRASLGPARPRRERHEEGGRLPNRGHRQGVGIASVSPVSNPPLYRDHLEDDGYRHLRNDGDRSVYGVEHLVRLCRSSPLPKQPSVRTVGELQWVMECRVPRIQRRGLRQLLQQ